MKVDIMHIAKLSRLKIEEEQIPKFEKDVENILSMVQNLPELDDNGALIDPDNPMTLREDKAEQNFKRDELLKNAPATKAGCVVVPKVVE